MNKQQHNHTTLVSAVVKTNTLFSTRGGFLTASSHRNHQIENIRWVSFNTKFSRQGFENACWHREACQAIQHACSKLSLINLIIKDANLVSLFHSSNLRLCHNFRCLCWFSIISDVIQKTATSSWPDKGTCREIDNVYQATRNNAVNMRGNWSIKLTYHDETKKTVFGLQSIREKETLKMSPGASIILITFIHVHVD